MSYSIDSSSLIGAWRRHYPPDIEVFVPIWEQIDTMIESGLLAAIDEVKREIAKKDDELLEWAKARPKLFHSIDEPIQIELQRVMEQFPQMVKADSTRNAADPWVVALAKATGRCVVTEESGKREPKIPTVCAALGVRCTTIVGMMREVKFASRTRSRTE